MNAVHGLVYRHRRIAKQAIAAANRVLPLALARRLRMLAEQVAFRVVPAYQGETLPPIFHYWSGSRLAPWLAESGLSSPEDLYFTESLKRARELGGQVRIASFGAGACSLELSLAAALCEHGVSPEIECVDLNASLLDSARARADALGLADRMRFTVADCNRPLARVGLDVIVVNQFFHHVEDLETFCNTLRAALAPDGVLLTSDIVGRNGHVPWPAVDRVVQAHWQDLPQARTRDRHFGNKVQRRYVAVNHAAYSNEGVHAQDVVACLAQSFDFETFLTFGAAIIPFVERRIGFNFDRDDAADRDFINRVADADEAAIASGAYPASNMVATLRHRGRARNSRFDPVSPGRHVEMTREQLALARTG